MSQGESRDKAAQGTLDTNWRALPRLFFSLLTLAKRVFMEWSGEWMSFHSLEDWM